MAAKVLGKSTIAVNNIKNEKIRKQKERAEARLKKFRADARKEEMKAKLKEAGLI